jgi:hypothetical protein
MTDKKKLANMLPDEPAKPVLRRGRGLAFSTDTPATQQEETETGRNVETEKSTDEEGEKGRKETAPKVERTKPGYEIRTDLLKAVRRLAVDEDRFNYEIIEEALEEYLRKKGRL